MQTARVLSWSPNLRSSAHQAAYHTVRYQNIHYFESVWVHRHFASFDFYLDRDRGRDLLQSISFRRKFVQQQLSPQYIYKFFEGRRVLLAAIPYWCWTLVTQVLVTGNQGAPALILQSLRIAFVWFLFLLLSLIGARLDHARTYKALPSKSCSLVLAARYTCNQKILF